MRWEISIAQGEPHLYSGQVDFFLGTTTDLEIRILNGCKSCYSILHSRDVAGLEEKYGKVYGVSAHFRSTQPFVFIIKGNLDEKTQDPSNRRASMTKLKCRMLLSTNPALSASQIGRGRVYDVDCCNVSLIRRWIDQCDKHHAATCSGKHEEFLLPKAKLSFIDVEERCITTPENPVQYAALSYVWGTAKVPVATKANIQSLRLPGAFSQGSLELPATIRDAVQLCSWIGIRYLWVDSMCIVQDDMQTKMKQIKAMGSVYAGAHLTIVALLSEAATSGIQRVMQSNPSTSPLPFVYLPFQTLIDASQGAIGLPPLTQAYSKWSTRAWTLQEMVFSKRLLVLGQVITWACSGAQWTEDLEVLSEVKHQSMTVIDKKSNKPSIAVWPSMQEYAELAQIYAGRDMTMSSDTLNAFEGIMTPMSQWFPGNFLFGIPEFTFDIGLLWQYRRRGAVPRSQRDWSSQQQDFPSWSWISYRGHHLETFWETDFSYPQPSMMVYPLVKWRKQEKATGVWKDVDNSYYQVRKHFENPKALLPDGWTKHFDGSVTPYYQHPSHNHVEPQPKFRYPIPPFQRLRDINIITYFPHLLFEGDLLHAKFQFIGTSEEHDALNEKVQTESCVPEMDIIDVAQGSWVGRIRLNLQQGNKLPCREEEQELIAISEARVKVDSEYHTILWSELQNRPDLARDGWYRFVNVLWIGRTTEGKVYRKALGRLWCEAMERLAVERVSVLLT
jgi:hypothetical protein